MVRVFFPIMMGHESAAGAVCSLDGWESASRWLGPALVGHFAQ